MICLFIFDDQYFQLFVILIIEAFTYFYVKSYMDNLSIIQTITQCVICHNYIYVEIFIIW